VANKHDCILCTFRNECPSAALILYAATPILRQIVSRNLHDLGSVFRLENDVFLLEEDPNRAIQGLRSCLSDAERADIRVGPRTSASLASGAALLAAPTLDAFGDSLDTAWFDEAILADRFTTCFQPIVDTGSSRVFAHECLIRLFSDRAYNGGEIVSAAVSRGRLHFFDSYARGLSIRTAGRQFRPGTKLFINFMPSSIYDPAFCMASTLEEMSKTNIRPADVVFEVVESDQVRDVRHLHKICEYYRKGGFGFALDDVGTGSSSLQMVCELQPDYIKLDKSLISGIGESMYRTAVQKLAEFACEYGVRVIAEGVETVHQTETLRQMGISLMQGYYFGKPAASMTGDSDLMRLNYELSARPAVREPVSSLVI
jgi:EAL domain-containing protein (putative c-di-GMP-specific phosphodiesterase class I)